ncbi:hypothetical protein AGMMS49953_07190 [Endomicrobiia bacterium]|uniref:glycosyltransferase n=1 Tax=Endomicrobium trichonymphae TaxID=1408204 RepID=UPI000BBABF25|nr:glycosyltransferase [Candidatus Endomicrobium trichonymphae]GHT24523.1 hypothetical protein AGMMS49953_07190 [Endomicrobiia bacterium]
MKLMIAIPVYSREKYLETTAKSLYEYSNIDKSLIRVFNDCSTEFDDNYLKQLFNKFNARIINREKNLKADGNAYQITLVYLRF